MKVFNNFDDVGKWIKETTERARKQAIEDIAREVYKDSEKYTFIDTKEMYNTGANSDFKNGYVLIKAPQVRRLYYTNWVKHPTNPNSRIQWFEVTKRENIDKYKVMFAETFNKMKR